MAKKKKLSGLEELKMYFLRKMGAREKMRGCKTLKGEAICCCVGFGRKQFEEFASLCQIEDAEFISCSDSGFIQTHEFQDFSIVSMEDMLIAQEEKEDEADAWLRSMEKISGSNPTPDRRSHLPKKSLTAGEIIRRGLRIYVVPEKDKARLLGRRKKSDHKKIGREARANAA